MAGGEECKHVSAVNGKVNLGHNIKNQTKEHDRKYSQADKKQEKKDYGSWGSTYKNKENFTNMHWC